MRVLVGEVYKIKVLLLVSTIDCLFIMSLLWNNKIYKNKDYLWVLFIEWMEKF